MAETKIHASERITEIKALNAKVEKALNNPLRDDRATCALTDRVDNVTADLDIELRASGDRRGMWELYEVLLGEEIRA